MFVKRGGHRNQSNYPNQLYSSRCRLGPVSLTSNNKTMAKQKTKLINQCETQVFGKRLTREHDSDLSEKNNNTQITMRSLQVVHLLCQVRLFIRKVERIQTLESDRLRFKSQFHNLLAVTLDKLLNLSDLISSTQSGY